jgi:chromosomal replication initiation ATPase DnaA
VSAQLILPLESPAALGRADFLAAPGNAQGLAYIDSYPGWTAPAAALYGPTASGKTHLVHVWAQAAGAAVIAAADLDHAAITGWDGPIAVENIDNAPGAGHESALFALLERGTPLLLTGQGPPAGWPAQLPDLASRFRALLGFGLWAPDDALLAALAAKLFADRQLTVPDTVIQRMVQELERSPAAIRDFVARADARGLAEKRPVNLGLIRDLLADPS